MMCEYLIESDALKEWFLREMRDLPWRNDRTPYSVWISEMMLQQTQVAVVIPYYLRWMEQFPTIRHLAEAPVGEVIKMWEGLGYYSRARYLHEGAQYIMKEHGGVFPRTICDLEKIKGLGPYTIGAILSFAYQDRIAAVDGNVLRVLARYFHIEEDIGKSGTIKRMHQIATQILPEKDPWIFNEALIELGATICTKKPHCVKCPLKNKCRSYLNGTAHQLPNKATKVKIEKLYRSVAIMCCQHRYLLKKGQKGQIMSDLFEFPYFESSLGGMDLIEMKKKIADHFCFEVKHLESLCAVEHSFTRFRAFLQPELFSCTLDFLPKIEENYFWMTAEEMSTVAFSSGHRRIKDLLLK